MSFIKLYGSSLIIIILCFSSQILLAQASAPNDSYFSKQWYLNNTGQSPTNGTSGADIDILNAWAITYGSSDVIIAILDSGISLDGLQDLDHPDLDDLNKIILGSNHSGFGGVSNVTDNFGHGTEVAGVAAAEANNGVGIAGVARNSKILAIKIVESVHQVQPMIDGIEEAVDYKINNSGSKVVINLSAGFNCGVLETAGLLGDLEAAIQYALDNEVLVVTVSHNFGSTAVTCPGALSGDFSNIITVASTDLDDDRSSFSNYGSTVNIAAPGGTSHGFNVGVEGIYSTIPVSLTIDDYEYVGGTSFAAPQVAGVAALLLSISPDLTASELRTVLESSADKVGQYSYTSGRNDYLGYGRLNAAKALVRATEYGALLGNDDVSDVVLPYFDTHSFKEDVEVVTGTTLTLNARSGTIATLKASSGVVSIGGPVANPKIISDQVKDVEVEQKVSKFTLSDNYPNPFNPATQISFKLPVESNVVLEVFNLMGQKVATLVNETREQGLHSIQFDASNLSSGIYIYRIRAGSFVQTKRMTLIK